MHHGHDTLVLGLVHQRGCKSAAESGGFREYVFKGHLKRIHVYQRGCLAEYDTHMTMVLASSIDEGRHTQDRRPPLLTER